MIDEKASLRTAEISTPRVLNAACISGGRGRFAPSAIFSATARPSLRAATKTPSAPSLAIKPGTPFINKVTSRFGPPTISGKEVIARWIRNPSSPAAPVAIFLNERAKPISDITCAGAPQPSIPIPKTASCVSAGIPLVIDCCSGCGSLR